MVPTSLPPRQSWIGKPRFLVEGVIYRYEVDNEAELAYSKPKQVPADKVVANIEGSWMKQLRYKLKGEKASVYSVAAEDRADASVTGMESLAGCRCAGTDTQASATAKGAG